MTDFGGYQGGYGQTPGHGYVYPPPGAAYPGPTGYPAPGYGQPVPPPGYQSGYQQSGYPPPGFPPPAPPSREPKPERFSPAVQALISALLLVPVLPIYYAASALVDWHVAYEWPSPMWHVWWTGCDALLPLYFVVVVLFRARPRRRLSAAAIAVATMIFQVGLFVLTLSVGALDHAITESVYGVIAVLTIMGYVGAWGVARRRNRIWAVGLVAAVICEVIVFQIYPAMPVEVDGIEVFDGHPGWFWSFAAAPVGAFVLSCLICWGFDALGGRSQRATTPEIPGR